MPLVDFSQFPIFLVVLVLSLTLHEAAHAWAAELLGDPTASRLGRLSFNPLVHWDRVGTLWFPLVSFISGFSAIGWTRPTPVDASELGRRWRTKLALIAAAGPALSLAIAALAAVAIRLGVAATGSGLDAITAPLLFRAVDVNVVLAVFNLLPIPPLDAGNALAGMMPLPPGASINQLRTGGMVLLFILVLSGVLAAVIRPVRAPVVGFLL